MNIVGIDPGLAGAVALFDTAGIYGCQVWDMPTLALVRGGKNKREVDAHHLAALIAGNRIGHAFVEQAWAMPSKGAHARGQGQGPSSAFASGKGYGIIIGALAALGVPYTIVPAARWKKALGVPAAKDGARSRASQLLPHAAGQWPLVKHDGRAEAALIALYGYRSFTAGGGAAAIPPAEAGDGERRGRVTIAEVEDIADDVRFRGSANRRSSHPMSSICARIAGQLWWQRNWAPIIEVICASHGQRMAA